MDTKELFEAGVNDALSGYVDANGLVKLLPDINNAPEFLSAMDKIRLGNGAMLTINEKIQLAMAWISFIGLNEQQKSVVSSKLMAIQDAPLPATPQQQKQQKAAEPQLNLAPNGTELPTRPQPPTPPNNAVKPETPQQSDWRTNHDNSAKAGLGGRWTDSDGKEWVNIAHQPPPRQ